MEPKRNALVDIARVVIATVIILLIPVVLRFPWTGGDFVIAGSLVLGAGLVYVLGVRKATSKKQRVILTLILLAAFLLVWAELAVGIFGTPFAGN